jgi:hypothetical protein
MHKKIYLVSLAGAALLCGCDKQTQVNTENIQALSQKIIQLQQVQAKQIAAIEQQLATLPPVLDKINDGYYNRSHADAFFYHTNTLYLLLSLDKKIAGQFQIADTERESENALAYYYHTNQTDTMFFCVGQIEDAMAGQETRIENVVNTETRRVGSTMRDELMAQIKASSPDKAEIARRLAMEAEVAQIQRDLDAIKARLEMTNQPAARP